MKSPVVCARCGRDLAAAARVISKPSGRAYCRDLAACTRRLEALRKLLAA